MKYWLKGEITQMSKLVILWSLILTNLSMDTTALPLLPRSRHTSIFKDYAFEIIGDSKHNGINRCASEKTVSDGGFSIPHIHQYKNTKVIIDYLTAPSTII